MPGLADILGQDNARQRIEALWAYNRVPHALMLEGPAHSGKMTAARILANILLCHSPRSNPAAPCGVCPACVKIAGGNHADLHFVNPDTKTIKIDEIRQACKALNLRPLEGTVKVLVIEDADRMNPPSQNALLKTLEEPPGAAHIMLTVSRLRAMLPTVVSRCQRVAFAPIPQDQVVRILTTQHGLAPEAAQLKAALAHGSVGRALELDLDDLQTRRDRIAKLDEKLTPNGPDGTLNALECAPDLSSDRNALLEDLDWFELWLRDQMLLASGVTEPSLTNIDRKPALAELAEHRGLSRILSRLRSVAYARRQLELPFNYNAQMIAEQLCLALVGERRLESI